MSHLSNWVHGKIKNCDEKLEKVHTTEEKIKISRDYTLIFSGASEVVDLIGGGEDKSTIDDGGEIIGTIWDGLEKRAKFEKTYMSDDKEEAEQD